MKTTDFKSNPRNPRKISEERLDALRAAMREFGDLSGIIRNKTTGLLVGGHQRVKLLGELPVTISKKYSKPTAQGTVAEGFVEYEGEKFIYREVKWHPTKEAAALVAANKHGGEFDRAPLKELLSELDTGEFDMKLTGFNMVELEELMTAAPPEIGNNKFGKTADDKLEGFLASGIGQIVLAFPKSELPEIINILKAAQDVFAVDNNSDAALAVLRQWKP